MRDNQHGPTIRSSSHCKIVFSPSYRSNDSSPSPPMKHMRTAGYRGDHSPQVVNASANANANLSAAGAVVSLAHSASADALLVRRYTDEVLHAQRMIEATSRRKVGETKTQQYGLGQGPQGRPAAPHLVSYNYQAGGVRYRVARSLSSVDLSASSQQQTPLRTPHTPLTPHTPHSIESAGSHALDGPSSGIEGPEVQQWGMERRQTSGE